MRFLNLGCGNRFHKSWTNIDFVSTGEGVLSHNLLKGIPFSESQFEFVYHSHLLEHFSKKQGVNFMKECYRVLKAGGIIRIAVPDLEQIVEEYINILKRINNNDSQAEDDYNWIMLEMYDQTVRNLSGGMMAEYIFQPSIPNEEFIYNRMGQEGKNLRNLYLNSINNEPNTIIKKKSLLIKIKNLLTRDYYFEKLVKLLSRNEYNQNKHYQSIGKFRESGEIHQWMYDKYSLSKLLLDIGFKNIIRRTASESYIDNWSSYNLDTLPDGSVRKPDSLFMEAIK